MKNSPEAIAIIAKLKRGKAPEADSEEESEDKGDVSAEAVSAACAELFRAIRGREPSDEETKATEEAMDSYCMAKGY